jgi:3'-phosphoadenosine 5'-phosphosulfate sulfotransferase (PAPS reductase)/FAD synthetase
MKFETLKETCLKYSKLYQYRKNVAIAKEIVSETLKKDGFKYVAFSGGKDSTCVAHLVLQQDPDILIFHWDYGEYYIPRELHKEIIKNTYILGAKNLRIRTSRKYKELKRNAVNVLGKALLGYEIPRLYEEGYRYCFLGLRKEESQKRKRRIGQNKSLTQIEEIYPIVDWSWLDVWTYIFEHNLPILSYYKIYGEVVGWDRVRFTTLFDKEFDKYGARNVDGVLYWKFKHMGGEA